jgi:protein farnesyltransferase subunit beta
MMEVEDVTEALRLLRAVHVTYLHSGLDKLPGHFVALDASRPWIVYWILHSLALLGADLPEQGPSAADIAAFLGQCQAATGGFGGGPMQIPHMAPTYAAVCALVTLGGDAVLRTINLPALKDFLHRMAVPPERGGGFCVHEGG